MRITWITKRTAARFSALLVASLALCSCERLEPAPEVSVVLQASGDFTKGPESEGAILLVRAGLGSLSLEVREREGSKVLAQAEIDAASLHALTREARGAIGVEPRGSGFDVTQPADLSRPVSSSEGTGGTFDFHGVRWMHYNAGYIEYGIEGRVSLRLLDVAGDETARFQGVTTISPPRHGEVVTENPVRRAVGTDVRGTISGSHALGGGYFTPNDAHVFLRLPGELGAGAIDVGGWRQVISFDPREDLTPPGGAGQVRLVHADPARAEISDSFSGHIQLRRLDLGSGRTGTGGVDVRFDLVVSVDPDRILVTGSSSLSGNLEDSEGDRSTFEGTNPRLETELEW